MQFSKYYQCYLKAKISGVSETVVAMKNTTKHETNKQNKLPKTPNVGNLEFCAVITGNADC